MAKTFKCPFCNKKYVDKKSLYNHIEKIHPAEIPTGQSAAQVYFNWKYNKTSGRCVMCGKNTLWNPTVERYDRLCSTECKERYKADFRKKMISKYGKTHLLNDPEQQKKMLANRSISGTYTWSDGKSKFTYTGSYEKDFLVFLDRFLNLSPNDVFAPAPQVFKYNDEDGTERFYIPDFFIASINTLVEVKDGGDNPNKHYHRTGNDARKEALKDELMKSQKEFNYVKVVNKDYSIFMNFLVDLRDENIKEKEFRKPIINIQESLSMVENILVNESFTSSLEGTLISEDIEKIDNESVKHPKIINNRSISELLESANNVYLASDWHLWVNNNGRIEKNLNFNNIIENCKKTLKSEDVLVYLGDLVDDEFKDTNTLKRVLESINCHKIITPGNNDLLSEDFYYNCGFDYVVPAFKFKNYIFSHYPIKNESVDIINFHGHLHGSGYYKVPYNNHADIYNRYGKLISLKEAVSKFNHGLYKPRKLNEELINEDTSLVNTDKAQLKDYINSISKCPYLNEPIMITESTLDINLTEESDISNIIDRCKANISIYSKTNNTTMLKNEACTMWYMFLVLENYAVHPLRKKLVHYGPVQKSNALKLKADMLSQMFSHDHGS